MNLLSTSGILKLINVPHTTFANWCDRGIVKPFTGGTGTGDPRRWTFTQAVGFVVAESIRKSPLGCSLKFFGATVESFGNVDEEWLNERFANGDRFYVQPNGSYPALRNDSTSAWPDAQEAFEKVAAYVAAKQPRETVSK